MSEHTELDPIPAGSVLVVCGDLAATSPAATSFAPVSSSSPPLVDRSSRSSPEWTDLSLIDLQSWNCDPSLPSSSAVGHLTALVKGHIINLAFRIGAGSRVVFRIWFVPKWRAFSPLNGKEKAAWEWLRSEMRKEWEWKGLEAGAGVDWDISLVFTNEDTRTLSHLYQNLPSPTLPTAKDISRLPNPDSRRLVSKLVRLAEAREEKTVQAGGGIGNVNGGKGKGKEKEMDVDAEVRSGLEQDELDWEECGLRGLKSRLYGYQLRSLIRMIMQERAPSRLLDPRFVKVKSAGPSSASASTQASTSTSASNFETFNERFEYYVDLTVGEVRRTIDWYDLPSGGVLCEEMGTGKTIMSLALILATKDSLPDPDPSTEHTGAMSTETLEKFPFEEHSRVRDLTAAGNPVWSEVLPPTCLPSLSQLCLHRYLAKPTHSAAEFLNKYPVVATKANGLEQALTKLASTDRKNANRALRARGSTIPYYHELPIRGTKCRSSRTDGGTERLELGHQLYLAKGTLLVVPVMLLHQWRSEILKHVEMGALDVEIVGEQMPDIARALEADVVLMSDARFRAEEARRRNGTSDGKCLLKCRWKRILVDEGHVTSSKNGDLMVLARKLNCAHYWAVTGTPTKNLLGAPHAFESAPQDSLLPQSPAADATMEAPGPSQFQDETWAKDALDDLQKLGVIFGQYLQCKPFHRKEDAFLKQLKDKFAFKDLVEKPLQRPGGPEYGAIERMDRIMQSLMIRNRAVDIEAEMPLPPTENIIVDLELTRYARMTYNVLIALIAANMITSERKDEDYMLHPKSLHALRLTMANLSMSTSWYNGSIEVDHAIGIADEMLENDKLQKYSAEDQEMLREAMQHLRAAQGDPTWQKISRRVSLPMEVAGLPDDVLQAASHFESTNELADPSYIVTTEALIGMRAKIAKYKGAIETSTFDDWTGHLIRTALEAKKREGLGETTETKKQKDKDLQQQTHQGAVKSSTLSTRSFKAAGDKVHQKVDLLNLQAGMLIDLEAEVSTSPKKGKGKKSTDGPQAPKIDLPDDLLDKDITFTSFSSKLNWAVREIQQNPDDTFILFSADVGVIGHLTEALEAAQIESCYVGMAVSKQKREEALFLFQTGNLRVCLMDLKIAARGLNLIVANRAIFVEPVWGKDVEAQAIKRIHRIGQRRATRTSTLYIKGSQEETMIQRRGQSLAQTAEEDVSIKELIAHPRFIDGPLPAPISITAPLVANSDRPKPVIKVEIKEEEEDELAGADQDVDMEAGPSASVTTSTSGASATSRDTGQQLDLGPREYFSEDEEEDVKPDLRRLEAEYRARAERDDAFTLVAQASGSMSEATSSDEDLPAGLLRAARFGDDDQASSSRPLLPGDLRLFAPTSSIRKSKKGDGAMKSALKRKNYHDDEEDYEPGQKRKKKRVEF